MERRTLWYHRRSKGMGWLFTANHAKSAQKETIYNMQVFVQYFTIVRASKQMNVATPTAIT